MTLERILEDLSNLDETELRTLNTNVIGQLKRIRRQNSQIARNLFKAGDIVGFGDPGGRGKRAYKSGTIVTIKRTRAEVQVGRVTWTVPLNMLEAVGG